MKKVFKANEIVEHCIKRGDFSTSYIQKTFNLTYPTVQRLLSLCAEMKIITSEAPRVCISIEEYQKNYANFAKSLENFRLN